MKPTLKDNGKIWLFRHKVFGLSAAKFEVQDDLLWCWVIGDEEPHGAFSEEFEWLGPAEVKNDTPAPEGTPQEPQSN